MWDLESSLRCAELLVAHEGSTPSTRWNLGPLHCERRVLATGSPWESLFWSLYGSADICPAPVWKCGAYHGGGSGDASVAAVVDSPAWRKAHTCPGSCASEQGMQWEGKAARPSRVATRAWQAFAG